MRVVVIGLLIAVAVWVIIAGLRNQKRVSFLTLFILLAPAGAAGYMEHQWVETQKEISVAIQKISGNKSSSLQCQRMSEGFFDVWASTKTLETGAKVGLKYKPCAALISWYTNEDKSKPTVEQISAIHLLTRETIRVTGQNDPSMQECLAMKNDAAMALELGADQGQANYIGLYYQQNIRPTLSKTIKNIYC